MAIFLDSGFFMGLIHKKDKNYQRANEILLEMKDGLYGQVYTSNFIMSESATLVAVRTNQNPLALEKIKEYFIGDLQIGKKLLSDSNIEKLSWDLFIKLNSHLTKKNKKKKGESEKKRKMFSFVDCSNIIFCQERNIANIAAFDGHFKGFVNLIC